MWTLVICAGPHSCCFVHANFSYVNYPQLFHFVYMELCYMTHSCHMNYPQSLHFVYVDICFMYTPELYHMYPNHCMLYLCTCIIYVPPSFHCVYMYMNYCYMYPLIDFIGLIFYPHLPVTSLCSWELMLYIHPL